MNRKKITYFLMAMMLCLVQTVFAQKINLSGEVLGDNSEPLIGATVMVKGTTQGVQTDLDGKFQLNTTVGASLVVTYVGYKPVEVKVTNEPTILINMTSESTMMDEVVVVGVSMKKSDLTGSVAQVNGDVLTEKPTTTINDAIQGRVPGVNVTLSAKPSDDA